MKISPAKLILVLSCIFLENCSSDDSLSPAGQVRIISESIQLNPGTYSPLTAVITVQTLLATKVSMRVVGKNGVKSDVQRGFDDFNIVHQIPVYGLYPNYDNTVELSFISDTGNETGMKSYVIRTTPLPVSVFPQITIDKTSDQMADGFTLVSYFGYNTNASPQHPFIFDSFGDIRWYLDFSSSPTLANMFYDDGMEILQNGNLYFGDGSTGTIYETDFFGRTLNTWPLPGYNFHHNVQEKPNGNFLVTVSKQGAPTVEDYIIEIDRSTKQILHTWDLNVSLQYSRQTLLVDPVDWVHVNAVIYDESDNTIIVSGRTQGLVKLNEDNQVVWILGCHKDWGLAGDGTDLNQFLLQPLDATDQPIVDQDVLLGNTSHADFEWNWYQHAPLLMPDGHVLLFDNGGWNRNFTGTGQYSRAVEYDINLTNKTVKQIWEYGKGRGAATLSPIVSDVDYLSAQNHVIFSPGAVNNGTYYGKVVEMDYNTQEVFFEATLTPHTAFYGITFHRTERIKFYP